MLLARVAGRGALPAGRWRQRLGARAAAAVARRREKREARATGLAAVWERYGWTAVGTHFGVYFATLAGLTSAVDQGLLGADATSGGRPWTRSRARSRAWRRRAPSIS